MKRLAYGIWRKLNKPEYWFQPRQLSRKLSLALKPDQYKCDAVVRLPWGTELKVKPNEVLGKSLLRHGVFELAVSEALWRLTDPGDYCLDIGANIGYMTSLLATRAGEKGKVFSFEPHPNIFSHLKANLQDWVLNSKSQQRAPISIERYAIGAEDGEMLLLEPDGFRENEGIAFLSNLDADGQNKMAGHRVQVRCLDSLLSKKSTFGVIKIDVEGKEHDVLRGATKMLASGRVRDIVYEDFQPFPSNSASLLRYHGFTVFRLTKAILGPMIWDPTMPQGANKSLPWEAVNYLATLDPDRAKARLLKKGWDCLKLKKRL